MRKYLSMVNALDKEGASSATMVLVISIPDKLFQ